MFVGFCVIVLFFFLGLLVALYTLCIPSFIINTFSLSIKKKNVLSMKKWASESVSSFIILIPFWIGGAICPT